MKTSILRTVCFALVIFLMNGFVAKAQTEFYDTKRGDDGRIISVTKYEMGDLGLCVAESTSKYTYDEKGDLLKKEVYGWNKKYVVNARTGFPHPDYSENNWTPQTCTVYKKNSVNNFVSIEFFVWNRKAKTYGSPVKTMVYQLNDSNLFNYLAFLKGNKFVEKINKINLNKELLAEFAEIGNIH